MQIAVLTYVESERSKEHDPVVDQVAEALGQGGHAVSIVGVHSDVARLLSGLRETKPDLGFLGSAGQSAAYPGWKGQVGPGQPGIPRHTSGRGRSGGRVAGAAPEGGH